MLTMVEIAPVGPRQRDASPARRGVDMAWIDLLRRGRRIDAANDYRRTVTQLIRRHGREKAMTLAVGGDNGIVGPLELVILDTFGLRDGDYLVDVGCGSGRLTRVAAKLPNLRYLGTDISRPLIDHARVTCGRADFNFALASDIRIPDDDGAADFVAFFSVGTHLMLEQFYVYLVEARRVLRPGGRIVLSFLDLTVPKAQLVFKQMASNARKGITTEPMNTFFSPDMIEAMASMLQMNCIAIVGGGDPQWKAEGRLAELTGLVPKAYAFGQSVAVLEKPRAAGDGG